jgi:hypothetical protein
MTLGAQGDGRGQPADAAAHDQYVQRFQPISPPDYAVRDYQAISI